MRLTGLIFFLLLPAMVMAQSTSAPAPAGIDLHPLLTELMPYIISALGALITAIVGLLVLLVNKYSQKIGIEISQAQAARVTTALTNAAGGLIQQYGSQAALKLDTGHPAVNAAAGEVIARIPDALSALGITPDTLAKRILEKIPQVLPVEVPAPVIVTPAAPAI